MVQGWESNVNRKGDMEKLMQYKKVVSTFMLKIHRGGKLGNSVPKIEEKIFSSLFHLLPFTLPIETIPPKWMDVFSTISTKALFMRVHLIKCKRDLLYNHKKTQKTEVPCQ